MELRRPRLPDLLRHLRLATGQIEGVEGAAFEAGRMGEYTIETDPTRDDGLRVLMGPFTVYNATNIDEPPAPSTT